MKEIPTAQDKQGPSAERPDTTAIAMALRDTVGRFVRAVRSQSGTATTAQSEALAFLERDGPASVAALAASRGVKHQSMRLVVARLEELGLLELRPDPADRRGQLVSLTSAGRQKVDADRAARAAHLAQLLSSKLSPAELVQLSAAIALIDRLSTLDGADKTSDLSAELQ